MTEKKQIIRGFVQHHIGFFIKGDYHNPVQLHKHFISYLKQYPLDSEEKYCYYFGKLTKSPLRSFFVNDLGLEYCCRKAGYFIRYDFDYCNNLNDRLYNPILPAKVNNSCDNKGGRSGICCDGGRTCITDESMAVCPDKIFCSARCADSYIAWNHDGKKQVILG